MPWPVLRFNRFLIYFKVFCRGPGGVFWELWVISGLGDLPAAQSQKEALRSALHSYIKIVDRPL